MLHRATALAAALAFVPSILAGPAVADSTVAITGEPAPRYETLDALVTEYMQAHGVPNAELAISSHGSIVFSHAYTNGAVAGASVTPATIFRLASNSKAWTSAAIDELMAQKIITGNERVFSYLGISEPLPRGAAVADPRVLDITVRQLADHTAGWDRAVTHFDPMHAMRRIALEANLGRPVQPLDIARYMLSQPLQHAPGSTYAYCNVCYLLLGMVIEKAGGEPFLDYVDQRVAAPLGVADLRISPTEDPRLPGEVRTYVSSGTGLSPLHIESDALVGDPNGGDGEIREVARASGGLATSAESMLRLMGRYAIWGLGPPPVGRSLAREGAAAGTDSYARQGANGVNYAIILSKRDEREFADLHERIDRVLDASQP